MTSGECSALAQPAAVPLPPLPGMAGPGLFPAGGVTWSTHTLHWGWPQLLRHQAPWRLPGSPAHGPPGGSSGMTMHPGSGPPLPILPPVPPSERSVPLRCLGRAHPPRRRRSRRCRSQPRLQWPREFPASPPPPCPGWRQPLLFSREATLASQSVAAVCPSRLRRGPVLLSPCPRLPCMSLCSPDSGSGTSAWCWAAVLPQCTWVDGRSWPVTEPLPSPAEALAWPLWPLIPGAELAWGRAVAVPGQLHPGWQSLSVPLSDPAGPGHTRQPARLALLSAPALACRRPPPGACCPPPPVCGV